MENISAKIGNRFILAILLWFIVSVLVLTPILRYVNITTGPVIVIGQLVMFLIPFIVYLIVKKENFIILLKNVTNLKSLSFKNIAFVLGMMLLLHPTILLISFVSSLFTPNTIAEVALDITTYGFVTGFLIIAITPSILEELIFRGVLFHEYRNVNLHKAALMNGLFFGIIHMNLHQAISAFVLGTFFVYLIYYTKSFFSVFLAHVYFNGVQFALLYFTASNEELFYEAMAAAAEEDISVTPIIILALLTLPLFFVLFRKFKKYNEKNKETKKEEYKEKSEEKVFTISAIISVAIFIIINILEQMQ